MAVDKISVAGTTAASEFEELGWVQELRMKALPERFASETVEVEVKSGVIKLLKLPLGYDSIAIGKDAPLRVYVNGAADREVASGSAVRLPLGKKGDKCSTEGLDLPTLESRKYAFRNSVLAPDCFEIETGERISVTLLADRKIFINLYGIRAQTVGFADSVFDNTIDLIVDPEEGECGLVVPCNGNDVVIISPVLSAALREQAYLERTKDGGFLGIAEFTILEGRRFSDIYRYLGTSAAELSRKAVSEAEVEVVPSAQELEILAKDETEILISGRSIERNCVQDKRFSVTALRYEGDDEREAGKLEVSLIDFGRFDEDPWPLIDGCGDSAAELSELLYDRYEKAGEPERIREPFLFIEGAEGEKEALTYLFANLPYAYKKLYGPRVVMIGAREKTLDFDVPEEFVAEFRDAECGYVLYRLDGNVMYRKLED